MIFRKREEKVDPQLLHPGLPKGQNIPKSSVETAPRTETHAHGKSPHSPTCPRMGPQRTGWGRYSRCCLRAYLAILKENQFVKFEQLAYLWFPENLSVTQRKLEPKSPGVTEACLPASSLPPPLPRAPIFSRAGECMAAGTSDSEACSLIGASTAPWNCH